jgi:RNA polymerase sigma-70 factor, ECF subfamily
VVSVLDALVGLTVIDAGVSSRGGPRPAGRESRDGAQGVGGEAGVGELGERFPGVLASAAAGDPEAFAELWRATHPVLLRYLKVVCGDQAEDVASETWLKTVRALPSFVGDEQAFRGWLTVVARNHVRDVGRRAARRPEALTAEPPTPARGTAPDAADEALERLGTERALRLLASLPAAQAEMVALRVIVGLEPAEVARIVGRSPGAVRVAVHRALGTLAQRLTGTAVTTVNEETLIRRHG